MSDIPKITFTDEPIPSGKMAVLDANTRSLDAFMNSDESATQDRNGDDYPTRKQLIKNVNEAINNIGYVISGGTFESGATLTQQNAALLYQTDNQYYQWTGPLPKVVPASSTPQSTGGIANGAWILAGDSTLRKELSGSNGTEIIGNGDISLSESLSTLPNSFKNIYDIFIINGQSNAAGKAKLDSNFNANNLSPVPDHAYYWHYLFKNGTGQLEKLDTYMEHATGDITEGGAWNQFATTYIQKTGRGVIFIPAAMGSSSIDALSKGGVLYDRMEASIKLFNETKSNFGLNLGGLYTLFHQGETDMSNGTSYADYKTKLKNHVNNFFDDFNIHQFYIFIVGCPLNRPEISWQRIQNAQIDLCNSSESVRMATDICGTFTKSNGNLGSDGVHYTSKGYNLMGLLGANQVADDTVNLLRTTPVTNEIYGRPSFPNNVSWKNLSCYLRCISNEWVVLNSNTSTGIFKSSNVDSIEINGNIIQVNTTIPLSSVLSSTASGNGYSAVRGFTFGCDYNNKGLAVNVVGTFVGYLLTTDMTVHLYDDYANSSFELGKSTDNGGDYYYLKHPETFDFVSFEADLMTEAGSITATKTGLTEARFRIANSGTTKIWFNIRNCKIDLTKYLNPNLTICVTGVIA